MLLEIWHTAPYWLLIAVAGSLVIAGWLKGVIGVGMPIIALPLLSMLIDEFRGGWCAYRITFSLDAPPRWDARFGLSPIPAMIEQTRSARPRVRNAAHQ